MMKNFNAENYAKNLPDAYKKTPDSNNYKILEIERLAKKTLREDLQQIENILSIDNAKGQTLDNYGERIGQQRGAATDAQYLLMLKAKIMRRMSNGSYNDVINAVCQTFGCEPSEITIKESETPCVIEELSVPLDIINKAGLSSRQAHQIITSLLPVGMSLTLYVLEGTFCFADMEGLYDFDAGFNFDEESDVGGYFGATGEEGNDAVLPI